MRILAITLIFFGFALSNTDCKEVEGYASWYGKKFHGRKTASGEIFNKYKYTAASKVFPINTYVLVRNLENGKEVIVRITDIGPFVKNRILDLSKASAEKLGMIHKGKVRVSAIPLYCVADEEKSADDEYLKDLLKTY